MFGLRGTMLTPENVQQGYVTWFSGTEETNGTCHVGEVPTTESSVGVICNPVSEGSAIESFILLVWDWMPRGKGPTQRLEAFPSLHRILPIFLTHSRCFTFWKALKESVELVALAVVYENALAFGGRGKATQSVLVEKSEKTVLRGAYPLPTSIDPLS
jgi:hypothetical protein